MYFGKMILVDDEKALHDICAESGDCAAEAGDTVVIQTAITLTRPLVVRVPLTFVFSGNDASLDTSAFPMQYSPQPPYRGTMLNFMSL